MGGECDLSYFDCDMIVGVRNYFHEHDSEFSDPDENPVEVGSGRARDWQHEVEPKFQKWCEINDMKNCLRAKGGTAHS